MCSLALAEDYLESRVRCARSRSSRRLKKEKPASVARRPPNLLTTNQRSPAAVVQSIPCDRVSRQRLVFRNRPHRPSTDDTAREAGIEPRAGSLARQGSGVDRFTGGNRPSSDEALSKHGLVDALGRRALWLDHRLLYWRRELTPPAQPGAPGLPRHVSRSRLPTSKKFPFVQRTPLGVARPGDTGGSGFLS